MPYINPNANLDLVQDVLEPSSVPICHVYWYKDAVPLCSRRKPQWVGQVDCHGGHFVRCSNCLGPMVLPMFLPWFYTLLHIVYHIFLRFYHVLPCFPMFFPSTTDLKTWPFGRFIQHRWGWPCHNTTKKFQAFESHKMGPGKPVGKVGWVRTSFLGVKQPPVNNPFIRPFLQVIIPFMFKGPNLYPKLI